MAMAIFTIGILGLFGMQTAAIKENLAANTITTGATWAADQVEQIIADDYTALLELDLGSTGDKDGCAGLDDQTEATADDYIPHENSLPVYKVYYNVARDCLLSDIPDADTTQEQKPLSIRIIVTKGEDEDTAVVTAVFNYIKQNSAKD